ncbi:hypothetical protein HDU79_002022 [Rhizoclosmatium sp. JEL0117]|nr:hypothetical protein HDU79_002022 [Rhizoclosmatium sp. JEL0117]
MAANLTATILYAGPGCPANYAIRIDYAQPTSAGCGPATISTSCANNAATGLSQRSACVDSNNLATFGNGFFLADSSGTTGATQIQSLITANSDCSGPVIGGSQVRLASCFPTTPDATSSAMFNIDVQTGSLYLSTFSDDCTTLTNSTLYSSSSTPSCITSKNTKVTTLNPSDYVAVTTYSSNTCTTPAKIEYAKLSIPCTENPVCHPNGYSEFITTTCSKTNQIDALAKTTFGTTPYFKLYSSVNVDATCSYPVPPVYQAIGVCYPSQPFTPKAGGAPVSQSVSSSLSANGTAISVVYYVGTGCQGGVYRTEVYPVDGTCTSNGRVVYSPQAVVTGTTGNANGGGNNGDGGSSGAPVGAIAGGVVGGLVVLGLIGFAVYYSRNKKNAVDSEKLISTGPPAAPPGVPGSSTSANQGVIGSNNAVYGGSTEFSSQTAPTSQQTGYPSSVSGSSINPAGLYLSQTAAALAVSQVDTTTIGASSHGMSNIKVIDGSTLGSTDNSGTEKPKDAINIFGELNAAALGGVTTVRMSKADEAKLDKLSKGGREYETQYGQLILPTLPSQWTIQDVHAWVQENEGSPEMLTFVKEQEIDGRALLLLTQEQLGFLKVGARVKFWEKLNELRQINASASDELNPPPQYAE